MDIRLISMIERSISAHDIVSFENLITLASFERAINREISTNIVRRVCTILLESLEREVLVDTIGFMSDVFESYFNIIPVEYFPDVEPMLLISIMSIFHKNKMTQIDISDGKSSWAQCTELVRFIQDEFKLRMNLEHHLLYLIEIFYNNDILLWKKQNNVKDDKEEITDENGWTCLHWACYNNMHRVALWLLDSGANADAKTRDGKLPRELVPAQINVSIHTSECLLMDMLEAYES